MWVFEYLKDLVTIALGDTPLCRHDYEYMEDPFTSLTYHRGCKLCGIVEYNRTGLYWSSWAEGWTWDAAKKSFEEASG